MAIRFVIRQNGSGKTAKDNAATAEYVFDENLFTIGSDAANHLVLAESAAEQAIVVREEEFLTLINRSEGTSLNGKALRREAFLPLGHGDRIQIGTCTIVVFDSENEAEEDAPAALFEEIPKPADPLPLPEKTGERKHDTFRDAKPPKIEPAPNFAAILDTLRTEEDSFYFIVENKAKKELRRIRLEQAEMMIGANQRGEIVGGVDEISTICAVARKDWNGILLDAHETSAIIVNGEPLTEARRLRDGDRVGFSAVNKETLVLHEPSSLVALESMLASRSASDARFGIHQTKGTEDATAALVPTSEKTKSSLFERTFFGYFSFLEVVTMFFSTLIGAVLVFLFLEFMFS